VHVSPRVVVGAAIVDGDRLLAAQRSTPAALAGRWELPGGKVDAGETDEAALIRECREELGVDVMLGARVGRDWPIGEDGVLRVWLAGVVEGEPVALEHSELRWLTVDELHDVEWLPADLPVIDRLAGMLLDTQVSGTEVPLRGGNVGGAVRVDRTVRRPVGEWTPAVHALLDHLGAAGLDAVPRVFGYDEAGREVLEYVPGDTADAHDAWPAWAWSDTLLIQAAQWLRRYHDAVASFRAVSITRWRFSDRPLADDEIVCHHDVSPYNVVVGFDVTGGPILRCIIDWDVAGPGQPLDDLAFMAWNFLPCYDDWSDDDVLRRLRLLADHYGSDPRAILTAIVPRMRSAYRAIRLAAAAGDVGMRNLMDRGHVASTEAAVELFSARLPLLVNCMNNFA
jgi:mutator protein MutT